MNQNSSVRKLVHCGVVAAIYVVLCLDRANLIVYSHGEYLALGKKLGTFGYSVRKKKPAKRKKQ